MSEKIRYTDEPLGNLEVVPDFLPRPEDLVFRDEGVKVTISLSKRSVEFFKNEARKHNTQYQRMIRRLLDAYAEHLSEVNKEQAVVVTEDGKMIYKGARGIADLEAGTPITPDTVFRLASISKQFDVGSEAFTASCGEAPLRM